MANERESNEGVEGEGSYKGSKDYNARTKEYMKKANVEEDARNAAPSNDQEAKDMQQAEAAGKRPPARHATTPADETPEAKRTQSQKSRAGAKMFKDADDASRAGLPPDITHEQFENMQRRAVLGY